MKKILENLLLGYILWKYILQTERKRNQSKFGTSEVKEE